MKRKNKEIGECMMCGRLTRKYYLPSKFRGQKNPAGVNIKRFYCGCAGPRTI